jgi:hypothetical protein
MSVPSPSTCTFRTRQDEFSTQISCDQDPKFWFRLESVEGCDTITDFVLGNFGSDVGGDLLAMCYKKINRIPPDCLVFGDILSSRPSDAVTVDNAKARLEGYVKAMLAGYGRFVRTSSIVPRRNKLDLVIAT